MAPSPPWSEVLVPWERASGTDSTWVRTNSAVNPMVITAALLFDAMPGFDAVVRLITERLLPEPRFRQRIVRPPWHVGATRWEPDPAFDPAKHIHRTTLPAPADRAALERLLGDLASTTLPESRAPWEVFFVEAGNGTGALVMRIHHAIGDGSALMQLLDRLVSNDATVPVTHVSRRRIRGNGLRLLRGALALGQLLLARSDSHTSLKRRLGPSKSVGWNTGIPLADMKSIAHAVGGRLNDVLLAAVTGALRELLVARGERADDCTVHAVVPMDFRTDPAVEPTLGNRLAVLFVPLPMDRRDALARLKAVVAASTKLKRGVQGPAMFEVLGIVGHTNAATERVLLDVFDRKGSLVVTNVVGPPDVVHVAGRAVREILAWVPQAGHLGLGVSLVSYAGHVNLGVLADTHVVPDASALVRAIAGQIETLTRQLAVTDSTARDTQSPR